MNYLLQFLGETTGLRRELGRLLPMRASADRIGSRRTLLFGGAIASALAAMREARADPQSFSATRWLVNRLTYGATAEELSLVNSLGYANYLEYHLNPAGITESATLNTKLSAYTTLTMTPQQLATSGLNGGQVSGELVEAAIFRGALTKRQLFERMVEFWTDHFNIDINFDDCKWLKTIDDRDVIRANALGTFPALLSASAHSPAMMNYLNNDTNVAGNPNENYARELMELHTMGVDGGYTQQDVVEVARCFTGWTYYRRTTGMSNLRWLFQYDNTKHDQGAKIVLGQNIPANGGQSDANTVLNILSNHASTARFIAGKLCKFFWSYDPPQSLIDAVAATYTSTGGDIKQMLRTLFNTMTPTETGAPLKYKRPYHQLMAGLRLTNATINNVTGLRTQLTSLGQLPFQWSPPDGYPDKLESWVGLILPRWSDGALMIRSSGGISGVVFDSTTFYAGLPGTPTADDIVNRIDSTLFGGAMGASDKNRIKQYVQAGTINDTRKRDAIGLAIGSPGFQWY